MRRSPSLSGTAAGVGRTPSTTTSARALLPPAQKASATRSIYDGRIWNCSNEITRPQEPRDEPPEIRTNWLSDRVEAAAEDGVDLVAEQSEGTRNAILQVAARRFAERGYDRTRIADICKE
jgi:hypothetical protein